MNKKRFFIGMLAAFIGGSALISAGLITNNQTTNITQVRATEVAQELDLTTIPFSNTPVAGWGTVQIGHGSTGEALSVNGHVYEKGIGTHPFNDMTSTDADIEYDITTLATQYEYFETKVAVLDNGNTILRFAVLVDGEERDYVYWRTGKGTYNDGDPLLLRCRISGGSKLTLRVQCSYFGFSNGACGFLEPKLYNIDPAADAVNASEIFERGTGSNGTGWTFITGGGPNGEAIHYAMPILDKTHNARDFSDYAQFSHPAATKTGFGIHLKECANYETYAANKEDGSKYVSLKFNIKGKGFGLFNFAAGLGAGNGGCYFDAWADGIEIAHDPNVAIVDRGGNPYSFAIPEGTEEFEIRCIAANGMANGAVQMLGAQFIKASDFLYSKPARETVASGYDFGAIRGQGILGEALDIHDSATDTDIPSTKGLFMMKGYSYEFPVDEIDFDTISGTLASSAANPSHPDDTKLVATFKYPSKTVTEETKAFGYATSNTPFALHFNPEGLESIKLEMTGTFAFSNSVINAAKFSTSSLKPIFDILDLNSYDGEPTRPSGDCSEDFAAAKALVLGLGEADLENFKTSDSSYITVGRNRYEAWAAALGEDPYANSALTLGGWKVGASNNGGLLAVIGILALTASTLGIAFFLKKKRKN